MASLPKREALPARVRDQLEEYILPYPMEAHFGNQMPARRENDNFYGPNVRICLSVNNVSLFNIDKYF